MRRLLPNKSKISALQEIEHLQVENLRLQNKKLKLENAKIKEEILSIKIKRKALVITLFFTGVGLFLKIKP